MRLFVYGSLKRGFRHHEQLRGAECLGEARTAHGWSLRLQGEYPALVREGAGVVHGEVYSASARLLERLDAFEDVPHLYQRVEVDLSDGSRAQAYAMSHEAVRDAPVVAGGCWIERQR